jgi:biotin carboxyl carrier protein
MKLVATVDGEVHEVEVTEDGGGYRVTIGERSWQVDARAAQPGIYSLLLDGASYVADVAGHGGTTTVDVGGERYEIQVEERTRWVIRTRGGAAGGGGGQTLVAPLPGRITHVAVRPGDAVARGDALLVIEAMKMENELRAGAAGTVAEVRVAAGQPVNAGDVLVVIA